MTTQGGNKMSKCPSPFVHLSDRGPQCTVKDKVGSSVTLLFVSQGALGPVT